MSGRYSMKKQLFKKSYEPLDLADVYQDVNESFCPDYNELAEDLPENVIYTVTVEVTVLDDSSELKDDFLTNRFTKVE